MCSDTTLSTWFFLVSSSSSSFFLELQLLLFHIDFCTAWPARLDVGPLLYWLLTIDYNLVQLFAQVPPFTIHSSHSVNPHKTPSCADSYLSATEACLRACAVKRPPTNCFRVNQEDTNWAAHDTYSTRPRVCLSASACLRTTSADRFRSAITWHPRELNDATKTARKSVPHVRYAEARPRNVENIRTSL